MPHPVGYSFVSSAKLTGNAQVNSLLYGTYWKNPPGATTDFTTQASGAMLIEAAAFLKEDGVSMEVAVRVLSYPEKRRKSSREAQSALFSE